MLPNLPSRGQDADEVVQNHISLLHEYNEVKDITTDILNRVSTTHPAMNAGRQIANAPDFDSGCEYQDCLFTRGDAAECDGRLRRAYKRLSSKWGIRSAVRLGDCHYEQHLY